MSRSVRNVVASSESCEWDFGELLRGLENVPCDEGDVGGDVLPLSWEEESAFELPFDCVDESRNTSSMVARESQLWKLFTL